MSKPHPAATVFVGDIFTNRYGCKAEVIKYDTCKRVVVKFLDEFGYELHTTAAALRHVNFKNPFHKTVYGVAYVGVGDHKGGKSSRAYTRWINMLERCYANTPKWAAAYSDCTVAPEWLNFQNFADWYYSQPTIEKMQIDKDILHRGNRVYSADNCRLVPSHINKATMGGQRTKKSGLPVGVYLENGRYKAEITKYSKSHRLGVFDTPEQAFHAYKLAKEAYIRELAELYKEVIAPEMLVWEVEIGD